MGESGSFTVGGYPEIDENRRNLGRNCLVLSSRIQLAAMLSGGCRHKKSTSSTIMLLCVYRLSPLNCHVGEDTIGQELHDSSMQYR
jgi:hypothetical protein